MDYDTRTHNPNCDQLFDRLLPCNCDEIEFEEDHKMSGGEIAAWIIFFVVVSYLMLRILVNIYTI